MELEKVKWIIDNIIIKNSLYENLSEIIKKLGMECKILPSYSFIENTEMCPKDGCVITYTSILNYRKLPKYFGTYNTEKNLTFTAYSSLLGIDNKYFLNDDAIITTFYKLRTTPKEYWFNLFFNLTQNKLFIKPNSGIKLFTGFVISYNNYEHELNYLKTTGINDDSLIIIAKPKWFWDETRFIICNHKIVDASRYAYGTAAIDRGEFELVEDKIFPKELYNLAELVAKCEWQPDPVYTLDLCMTRDGPKIVEINSFSCASFYACDAEKIVKEVSEFTLKLWEEQYEQL